MFEAADIREWRGHDVVDVDGHKIDELEAVYVDTGTDQPSFATVTVGLPTRHRLVFVPLAQAVVGPGYLRVGYGRKQVKDALSIGVVTAEPVLTGDEEEIFPALWPAQALPGRAWRATAGSPLSGVTRRRADDCPVLAPSNRGDRAGHCRRGRQRAAVPTRSSESSCFYAPPPWLPCGCADDLGDTRPANDRALTPGQEHAHVKVRTTERASGVLPPRSEPGYLPPVYGPVRPSCPVSSP